jgi:FkbH-like protein
VKIKKIVNHIENWLSVVTKKFTSTIIVCNFNLPAFNQKGVADVNDSLSEMRFYGELNMQLEDLLRRGPRTHLFDIARLSARSGLEKVCDPKMFYLAKMYWSEQFLPTVAEEITRYIIAIQGWSKKCLVLDLDNTIWGGAAGEEGPLEVKIGLGDPISEAYLDFQYEIKALKDRGILLAICSKNNRDDALEVFRRRPEMPLQITDFAAMEINWDNKHSNIMKIAETLNIGIDSLVFIDDNPAECSLIQQMLPRVKTVLLPANHEEIAATIQRLHSFEKVVILQEDQKKTEQYQRDNQREVLRGSSNDLTTYLYSLKTEICIKRAEEKEVSRIHQLFLKTNQFNVTTIRYSVGRIEQFLKDPNYELWYVIAHDCFGLMGIIGLYLQQEIDGDLNIDSFILSCRAMGRDIEVAVMNHIKQQYLLHENGGFLTGRYDPTRRNKPVSDFFEKQGFLLIDETSGGSKRYRLSRDNLRLIDCPWITVSSGGNGENGRED